MKTSRTVVALSACLLSLAASGQWLWLDKDGRKVFSDRAPTTDVPAKNILKQPGTRVADQRPAVPDAAPAGAPATPASANAKAAPATGKSRELEEKKKQAEADEAAKKKAEDEKYAKARSDNCERARRSKATMDSGVRVARTNEKGEREIMDDAARAVETQRLQGIIDSDCR